MTTLPDPVPAPRAAVEAAADVLALAGAEDFAASALQAAIATGTLVHVSDRPHREAASKTLAAVLVFTRRFDDMPSGELRAMCERIVDALFDAEESKDAR